MPVISCLEPGCGAVLANPCAPLMALFTNKRQLLSSSKGLLSLNDNQDLRKIDIEIEKGLGLQDAELHYAAFEHPESRSARMAGPKLFLLKCFRDHVHQYNVNCP